MHPISIKLPVSLVTDGKENSCNQEYVLLELPDTSILESPITIKAANHDDNLVLCTSTETFLMKRILSTNSTLLIENTSDGCTALTIMDDYVELTPFKPHLDSYLLSLLSSSLYLGEESNHSPAYTRTSLASMIPCSNAEFDHLVNSHPIIEHEGYTRLVSDDYLYNFLRLLVANYESMDISSIYSNEEYHPEIVKQLLPMFITNSSLNIGKIMRFFGEYLLRSRIKWVLQEFISSLNDLMLIADQTIDQENSVLRNLEGLYITEKSQFQNWIFYYPEHQLPTKLHDRFRELFRMRQKWLFEDISPFITPLIESESIEAILTKFTRSAMDHQGKRWMTEK